MDLEPNDIGARLTNRSHNSLLSDAEVVELRAFQERTGRLIVAAAKVWEFKKQFRISSLALCGGPVFESLCVGPAARTHKGRISNMQLSPFNRWIITKRR